MGRNRLARHSFGVLKICKDLILFELCLWKKKERKKERKKEEEERRLTKSKFSSLFFSNLLKFSGTFELDIALEY